MRILQNKWKQAVVGVAFNGRKLAAGGSGGFGVWYLTTNTPPWFVEYHVTKRLYAFELDPQNRWLFLSDPVGGCNCFSLLLGTWSRLPGNPYDHHVVSLAIHPEGSSFVASRGGAGTNRLECWDIEGQNRFTPNWRIVDGKVSTAFEPVYLNQAAWFHNAVAFSPDGRQVAVVEERRIGGYPRNSHVLVLRDTASGAFIAELGSLPVSVGCRLRFTPDGSRLVGWEDRWLEVWHIASATRLMHLLPPGRAYFRDVAIHPGSSFFVSVANDGLVRHWDLASFQQTRVLNWKTGKLHAVAFSPDGTRAAVGSDTGKVVVWDVDL